MMGKQQDAQTYAKTDETYRIASENKKREGVDPFPLGFA
jgi:hypothetical protein